MRYNQNHCNDKQKNDNTAYRKGIPHQFTHAVTEEGNGFAHNILLLLLFLCSFLKFL